MGSKFFCAEQATIKFLDKRLREKHEVLFFKNAKCKITFDNESPMGTHKKGQIAFLPWEPTRDDILNKRPIELMVAPPNCTHEPTSEDTEQTLTLLQWRRMPIGLTPERTVFLNGMAHMRAVRTQQYGLQLCVSP